MPSTGLVVPSMVPVKDPNLKGIGYSLCFLPVVPWFRSLLLSIATSVGDLVEQSTDLQKPQQKMVEAAGIETSLSVS